MVSRMISKGLAVMAGPFFRYGSNIRAGLASYWQISWTHRGRGGTGYVSNERHKEVRKQTENYRKFKEIGLKLIDLSIELAKLTDKETAS